MHRERPRVCHLFMCHPQKPWACTSLSACARAYERTGLRWWSVRCACFRVAHADEGPLAVVSPRPVMLACARMSGVLSENEDSIGRTGS